jgi:hypothetical protein
MRAQARRTEICDQVRISGQAPQTLSVVRRGGLARPNETAVHKLNDIDPVAYLRYVLDRITEHPINQICCLGSSLLSFHRFDLQRDLQYACEIPSTVDPRKDHPWFFCIDCDVETYVNQQYFMLTNHLWNDSNLSIAGVLCLSFTALPRNPRNSPSNFSSV